MALSLYDLAQEQVENVRLIQIQDGEWAHRQARIYLARKQYAEAQALLANLVSDQKNSPKLNYHLAHCLYAQGDYELALIELKKLLGPPLSQIPDAMSLHLRCFYHWRKNEAALHEFETYMSMEIYSSETWGLASLIAIDTRQAAKARLWMERALQINPGQHEALLARGILFLSAKDHAQAKKSLEQCLNLRPEDERCRSVLGLIHILETSPS